MSGMHYEGNHIIRPPSEARSILLQVTVGCSHNKCIFCPTYKGVRFKIKPDEIILKDLDYASNYYFNVKRLFIMDGDALILPQKKLVWLLKQINKKLPLLERIGIYANAKAIRRKTLEDLKELRDLKLGIIYYGIESGNDETLKFVKKGTTHQELYEQGRKVIEAGIKLSCTVLLGIAPNGKSFEHAVDTGKLLTKIDPDYVGALTVMIVPGTELYDMVQRGEFKPLNQKELLVELKNMLEATNMTHGLFSSNHASNYLPLKVKMPDEKVEALKMLEKALKGDIPLREEWMRGL